MQGVLGEEETAAESDYQLHVAQTAQNLQGLHP